jgi:tetratricopeptide (TPR) repeat protein
VIVSEFQFIGGNGLQLAQETRQYPDQNAKVFVMVSSDSSQSAVALAAEEDIDMFIVKPYTVKDFTELLSQVVAGKQNPSEYLKTIQAGKALLHAGKPREAIHSFDQAAASNDKPSLALYYRGQAELFLKLIEESEHSYKKGLDYNSLHYNCLMALFDLLMDQKRAIDAYEVVKKIASVFPANPKRLVQALSLAVQTHNFEDIGEFHRLYQALDERGEELARYVTAALVVAGKHFLRSGSKERAFELFQMAAVSCAGRTAVLREMISILVDFDCVEEAEVLLKRFAAASASINDVHYVVSRFVIANRFVEDPRMGVRLAKKSLSEAADPSLYIQLIQYLVASNEPEEAREQVRVAAESFPDSTADFAAALAEAMNQQRTDRK